MSGPASRPLAAVVLCVALGGALGALARWWLGQLVPDGGGLPWTTLAINASGSGLLALLPALEVVRRHPLLPPLLGTGVLGGYTTLSTYAEQARALAAAGRTGLAAAYVGGSLAACLAAVLVVSQLTRRRGRVRFERAGGEE